MSQPHLTHDEVCAAQAVRYVDTLYGRQVGLRRLTASFITRTQLLFAEPLPIEGGGFRDPLGIGFLDVECPACGAAVRVPCEGFASEPVPHEGRVLAARADRVARGNRETLRASIFVDPPVDEEFLAYLESDPRALVDLLQSIVEVNGLGGGAQRESARTFREGDPGSGEVPTGG